MARCDSYAFGNCTAEACREAPWIPEGLGDGGDWAANWQAQGGAVTLAPTVGSVVSYCRGDGYSLYGHVAYVEEVYSDGSFLVREMNYVAFDTVDERRSTQGDVCGFLLGPGMQPGQRVPPGRGAPGGGPPLTIPGELQAAWEGVRWWSSQGHDYEWGRQGGTERLRWTIPL